MHVAAKDKKVTNSAFLHERLSYENLQGQHWEYSLAHMMQEAPGQQQRRAADALR